MSSLENKFQQLIISESVETDAITGDDDNDWLVVKGRHPKERRVNEASNGTKNGSSKKAAGKSTAYSKHSNYKTAKPDVTKFGQKKLEGETNEGVNSAQKVPCALKYVPPPPPHSAALIAEENKVDLSADKISSLISALGRHSSNMHAASGYIFSPRGIVNNNCACFRNAVIQSLLATDPLLRCILMSVEAADVNLFEIPFSTNTQSSSSYYWMEFLSLIGQFYLPTGGAAKTSTRGVAAVDAASFIPKIIRTFQASVSPGTISSGDSSSSGKLRNKGRQEDAMEFLTLLLDTLHEEIVAHAPQAASATLPPAVPDILDTATTASEANQGRKAKQEDEEWNTVSKKKASKVNSVVDDSSRLTAEKLVESSIISRFFHGTLRSEVMYKAKKVNSITFQRFHCLTLDVQSESHGKKAGGPLSISSCLDLYFREEVLVQNEIHKQLQFEHLPTVLVLQLGRFTFDYSRNIPIKVHTAVEYPSFLDIPDSYLSADCKKRVISSATSSSSVSSGSGSGSIQKGVESSVRYALSSVILHHGRKATGGHYSANCRDPKTHTWRNFNDLKVRSLLPGEELSSTDTVYLLLYTKDD